MKTSGLRPQFAFTLVELLTVIAIIAILMGLLFPALSGARDNARKADAGTMIRTIANASRAYSWDYGKYPPIDEAFVEDRRFYVYGDVELSNGKAKVNTNEIFDVLRAIARDSGKNKDHVLNRRQQKYFEGKKANDTGVRKTRNGFADGREFEDRQGRLYDPWGTEYFVVLDDLTTIHPGWEKDSNGEDDIDVGYFWQDLVINDPIQRPRIGTAVAFSLGKDAKFGGKGYDTFKKPGAVNEQPDDIVSW